MNELWTYRLGAPFVRHLPRLFTYWIGLRVADRCYARDHHGREAVLSNLRRIFAYSGRVPATETLEGFARKTYQHFGKNIVDFFRFSHVSKRDVARLVTQEQIEHLKESHARGKGVIIASAHFGNWELGGAVLATLGYPVNAVVLPQPVAGVNRIYDAQRKRHGISVIRLGSSPLGLVRCLKKGELVALVADRDFSHSGLPVPFFGKTAHIPKGPAWLSLHTGAPIVPAFMLRLVDDTFLLRCHPPILPEEEGTLERIMHRINRVLEAEIAENPNQWFVFDDFWGADAGESAP